MKEKEVLVALGIIAASAGALYLLTREKPAQPLGEKWCEKEGRNIPEEEWTEERCITLPPPVPPPGEKWCEKEGMDIPEEEWTEERCITLPPPPPIETKWCEKEGGEIPEEEWTEERCVVPPPPEISTLALTSNPTGVRTYIDEVYVGTTPDSGYLEIEVEPNVDYTIEFYDDSYAPSIVDLSVGPGERKTYTEPLTPTTDITNVRGYYRFMILSPRMLPLFKEGDSLRWEVEILQDCGTYERCPSGGCAGGGILEGDGAGFLLKYNGTWSIPSLCWTPEEVFNNPNYQATIGEPNIQLLPGTSTIFNCVDHPEFCYDTNYKTAGYDCGPYVFVDGLLVGFDKREDGSYPDANLKPGFHVIELTGWNEKCWSGDLYNRGSEGLYFKKTFFVER